MHTNDLFAPLVTPRRERRAVSRKRYAAANWWCADHMARTARRIQRDMRAGGRE